MYRKSRSVSLIAAVALLIGIAIGFSFTSMARPAYSQTAPATAAPSGDSQTDLLRAIYNRVNPSVVSIDVRVPASSNSSIIPSDPFQPQTPRRQNGSQQTQPQLYQYGAGSGFVYDKDGHIVTNAHVVQDADQITVIFSDGAQYRADVVGIDADADIAVIKVKGDISKYTPLTLADSGAVQVGDRAIAIGNPFERAGTMTHGIVSATGRSVQGVVQNYVIPNAIQTDAPINPGNSGGPLLNANGEVIGINQQIASEVRQSSGVSFAIPSNLVKVVADTLIKDGKIEHSYLGIAGGNISLDLMEAMKLPQTTTGAYVNQVTANSPAAKAGLKAGTVTTDTSAGQVSIGGDIITQVDDQVVRTFDDLTAYLFIKTQPGQTVTLKVLRDGKTVDIKATLAARPTAK